MDEKKKNYSNDQTLTSNFMLKLMKKIHEAGTHDTF